VLSYVLQPLTKHYVFAMRECVNTTIDEEVTQSSRAAKTKTEAQPMKGNLYVYSCSRFSRARVVSDASFRRMTLPTLEPFRSTFGDCGCKTRVGRRSYVFDGDRTGPEIPGSLQSFSARCNHYSSIFGFCEFVDFPSIGTIETGASPSTHCGWVNRAPTAYILSERTAEGSDVDNQISFTSNTANDQIPARPEIGTSAVFSVLSD